MTIPLNKPIVIGYAGSEDYPIVAVYRDPRIHFTPPAHGALITTLAQTPGVSAWPNHVFVREEIAAEDKMLRWVFEKLPGVTLTSKYSDDLGILHTVEQTRIGSGTVTPAPSATVSDSVAAENAVVDVRKKDTASSIFDRHEQKASQNPAIPREFLNITSVSVNSLVSAGTDTTPGALGSDGLGVTSSERQRVDAFKVLSTDTTVNGTLSSSRTLYQTNELNQLVTVSHSYGSDNTPPAISELTEFVKIESAGDGKYVVDVGSKPEVLALPEYSTGKRILGLPEFFIYNAGTTSVSQIVVGNASAPTLTGNQINAVEKQLDKFTKRVSTETLGTIATGTSFTAKEWTERYGGGVVDHTWAVSASSTVPTSVATVEARSVPLGDGRWMVETVTNPSAWPPLTETEWDDFFQAFITTTKQIVAHGSVTAGKNGTTLTTFHDIDDIHTLKVITKLGDGSTLPSSYTLPVTVQVNTPPWFVADPSTVTATSGNISDEAYQYAMCAISGTYAGTLTREFFSSAPSSPIGEYLKFEEFQSVACVAHYNTGDYQYAKVNTLHTPNHISEAPYGTFIHSVQTQQANFGIFVRETVRVTI